MSIVDMHRLDRQASTDRADRETVLRQRLEDGYERIEQARLHGEDINRWESFWAELLNEYESVCRERSIAA